MFTRYKAWADAVLFQSLAELPQAELAAPRQIVFGSILRTLNHVCSMDLAWKSHLLGIAHNLSMRTPETTPAFSELRKDQERMDAWYVDYAANLEPEIADQVVDFTFIGGGDGAMSRRDILIHVVNHTTYHRGHIGTMIYEIPAEPPTTDLPVFLRELKAREAASQ
jgi:uncharacterized damage-inducible protein DinB